MSTKMKGALAGALSNVTAEFFKEKQRAAAQKKDELTPAQISRLRREIERDKLKAAIKNAAYEVMREAYLNASANGTLPANARQIMYAARPLVLAKIGKCWEKSSYFTQALLPDYIAEHPDETADWDIVYDARGHLIEPHVRKRLGLGTLEVRSYVGSWRDDDELDDLQIDVDQLYPTKGPANRYRFALFIEKEGFDHLLERARIAERFDIAIFSSKGMPTTATRRLVSELSRTGATILVVHDFDISGLGICHTLSHTTRRYEFDAEPNVIDIGLRLADVKALNLQSEPVEIRQKKDPSEKLWDYDDVEKEEMDFLVEEPIRQHPYTGEPTAWGGRRVELNAMMSDQFIAWLERKLVEAGVEKVVPDEATLAAAWRRAQLIAHVKESVEMLKAASKKYPPIPPDDLESRVREQLAADPALAWDEALALCNWDDPDESE